MIGETALFIQKFIQSPLQIGSLFPSSAALARKMTNQLNWGNIREAAELGAGTGVITAQILQCMQTETKLYVFEKDFEMRKKLQERFPNVNLYEDACDLLKSIGKREGSLDVVFSGLPFANFPNNVRSQIVEEVYASLRPGGIFIAFQYTTHMKRTLQHYFKEVEIAFVPKNFPPAFVYVCEK